MPIRPNLDTDDLSLSPEEGGDEDWLEASDSSWPRREAVVSPAAHGQRLDVFLAGLVPDFSRSYLKTLVESGLVQIDAVTASSASKKVLLGQTVVIVLKPTPQSQSFTPEPMNLDIVFEDEHLLVINKPAGMVVHPAAGNWSGTLMNGLLAHHAGAVDLPRAGIVHRLDKDTSGLMVVGKTMVSVTALSRAIAAREVHRQYLALVHGSVEAKFTVDAPIGRDPATRVRMAVVSSGKDARTDVECLLTGLVSSTERPVSGVRCTLHTGRTHQIRVHLSYRKHPLVADALYGGAPALGMGRQALHAERLSLVHPIRQELMEWRAPLPQDMAQAWDELTMSPQQPIRGA
ncbi:MAG TPA: RluA family pseudouridine synthase [Aquabacterium sp.]|nr:RluA family pseudouridine synthase [Aquabacterium sp.]